ncbi:MAG TPA: hypothetical protein EYP14_08205 [Planctomycetaceae bacterium]|nr:hypothetical protein [Planctomycetaceae bacterium]
MRIILSLLVFCAMMIGMVGCGSGVREPATGEDTAANPAPEMMEIPKPDELPKETPEKATQ